MHAYNPGKPLYFAAGPTNACKAAVTLRKPPILMCEHSRVEATPFRDSVVLKSRVLLSCPSPCSHGCGLLMSRPSLTLGPVAQAHLTATS